MTIRTWSLAPVLTASLGLSACGGSGSAGAPISASVAAAEARANAVAVSPAPGAQDVSPSTEIGFRGGPGTRVTDVAVVGSTSGPHSGTIEPYADGTGASFVLNNPFVAGEEVAVRALAGVGAPYKPVTAVFTIAR